LSFRAQRTIKSTNTMPSPATFNHDDEQLKLEMRAMAELLLDIYEYRLQSKNRLDGTPDTTVLDGQQGDRTMKERSTFENKNNIE
jgi:hypothetical protein